MNRILAALVGVCLAFSHPVEARASGASPDDDTCAYAPAPMAAGVAPPANGALLGMFYAERSPDDVDRALGSSPRIELTYFAWNDDWSASENIARDIRLDKIPLVNWEPFGVDFNDIVSGRLDADIIRQAKRARSIGTTFFLDFAAEMNEEEGWGGHDPELYIRAYRHVHDIFVQQGVDNVAWVWAPNNTDIDGGPEAMAYYPGDDYVDWIGIDGYNWGTSNDEHAWESFDDVFGPIYDKLSVSNKPIIIAETASDEIGGDKAQWIENLVSTLKERFPLIKALVWFDIKKERDWRIDSSPASYQSFKELARDPYFN